MFFRKNQLVENFMTEMTGKGYPLGRSQNKHVEHLLQRTQAQDVIAAVPAKQYWSGGMDGGSGYDKGVLCLTEDFVVFSMGSLIPAARDLQLARIKDIVEVRTFDNSNLHLCGHDVYLDVKAEPSDIKKFVGALDAQAKKMDVKLAVPEPVTL